MKYLSVFGPIRSGKTLIGRALNMHPDISVQQKPFFYFFKMCKTIFYRDILMEDYDTAQPVGTDFCEPANIKKLFLRDFSEIIFNSDDIAELKMRTIKQQESAGSDRAPHIIPFIDSLKEGPVTKVLLNLMQLLEKAYPKENLMYTGFTEAWCDDFISPLLNLNDNLLKFKCVHAIRDPRAIIASRNAGKKK